MFPFLHKERVMKKQFLFLFFLSFNIVAKVETDVANERFVIDGIDSVIFAQENTIVVTKSDVNRLDLQGTQRSRKEVIQEKLMFEDAKKYKIIPDENAINRYIATVQREHNLTIDQVKDMFNAAGYTYEEGRQQLGVTFAVNQVMDFKIRSRLIVPQKDINAYYENNPVYQDASYVLCRCVIPFNENVKKEDQKKQIINQMKSGVLVGVQWSDSFTIDEQEIAEDKRFITKMKVGRASAPKQVINGFEIFKLLEKKDRRLLTLQERYEQIADSLRRPRYEALLAEYKKELFEKSAVLYF